MQLYDPPAGSKVRGKSWQARADVLQGAFKIQSHLMFFDTNHNSIAVVHDALFGAFRETACKMWAYVRCLPRVAQPSSQLFNRKFPYLPLREGESISQLTALRRRHRHQSHRSRGPLVAQQVKKVTP